MAEIVISLDELIEHCGYFVSGVAVNNGYGCNHPEQQQREDGHGKCYGFSCPVATELNPQEEEGDREYFGDGDEWKAMSDGTWMLWVRDTKTED